jgi:hypothetical protein
MNKLLKTILLVTTLLCAAAPALHGEPLKAYVAPFTVTGAPNREELKPMLQTLLASRLATESLVTVDAPAGADLTVNGSYIFFGGVYSIDVAVKRADGTVVTRAFEQGENPNELIPLMKKLGAALSEQLQKRYPAASAPAAAVAQVPAALPLPAPVVAAPPSDIVRPATPQPAQPASEVIKPIPLERQAAGSGMSQRIAGELRGLATGRRLPSGELEVFAAGINSLRYYRQGGELKLFSQVDFSQDQEILSIDAADLDNNGVPEVYLTVINGQQLVSQVWAPVDNRLERTHDKLPYFFRAIGLAGGPRKLYAQQLGSDGELYGDVHELGLSGGAYAMKNPLKLPRFGYLNNFNQLKDGAGNLLTLVFNDDGYLIVFDQQGKELWRSTDKLGGSDVSYKLDDSQNMRFTGSRYRWRFLDQRITVLASGEVVVPQNSGTFVVGNQRSYKKSTVYGFIWNGSILEERWHLKENPSYLADYVLDEERKELLLLQVVKKAGIKEKGTSVLAVKKLD